jgi:MoaA/NifB/PqqE/SkfB family radical SAM enzyme
MDSCLCNHVLKKSTPTELQQLSIDTCEGARMSAYITPDMKLMPCSFANKGEWAISIGKKDIKEIWNNSKPFKKFRRMLRKQKDKCPLEL